jgi:hypothetical protein
VWIQFRGEKGVRLVWHVASLPTFLSAVSLYGVIHLSVWAGITAASVKILAPDNISNTHPIPREPCWRVLFGNSE